VPQWLERPTKQQVINKNYANRLRDISSAAVFSVSSNRLFKVVFEEPEVS
jgi:hypothetical protein